MYNVQWCVCIRKMALGSNYVFINTHLIDSIHFKPFHIPYNDNNTPTSHHHQHCNKQAHNHHLKIGCYICYEYISHFPLLNKFQSVILIFTMAMGHVALEALFSFRLHPEFILFNFFACSPHSCAFPL